MNEVISEFRRALRIAGPEPPQLRHVSGVQLVQVRHPEEPNRAAGLRRQNFDGMLDAPHRWPSVRGGRHGPPGVDRAPSATAATMSAPDMMPVSSKISHDDGSSRATVGRRWKGRVEHRVEVLGDGTRPAVQRRERQWLRGQ